MRGLPCGHDNILVLFLWIITNNFTSVNHILTKLGIKMHPYTTFLCTTFQGNWITCFHFMVTFTHWRKKKKKEKKRETRLIFESSYLGNTWHDLLEIWNVGYWWWRASPQQKLPGFGQAVWSYIYMKIALFFFLSINLWVWRAGFLGRMTHFHVSWWICFSLEIKLFMKGQAYRV